MRPFAPMMGQAPNKKKPGELIHNIKPLLKELMAPRWPRLVIGLVLVMIGRAAGLVAPASTRFLVDDIIGKRHLELLAPLTLGILAGKERQKRGLTGLAPFFATLTQPSWRCLFFGGDNSQFEDVFFPPTPQTKENLMRILSVIAVSLLLLSSLVIAQAPAQNPTNKTGVIGLMHAIHSVNDIEKTLAFYRDVFAVTGRAGDFDPKGPRILTNSPTATLRYAMTSLRGAFSFELTQFGDLDRQMNKQPDIQDPGAPMMKILVRDLDAVVASAKKANAPIVTKGGAPLMAPTPIGNARAIIMRDPDGYFIEAIQATAADIAATDKLPQPAGRGANATPTATATPSPIVGAILGATVRDMDETLGFWNGVLGMEMPKAGPFSNDAAMLNLMGLPSGASYRISSGMISGSTARIEFIEFKGVQGKPFDLRPTDAMACGMALRIGHIRDVLAKIKASGGRVLSKDQALVEWNETTRNVFVKDPNGLNLELVGSADPNL